VALYLNVEAAGPSSVFVRVYQCTWHHISEDSHVYTAIIQPSDFTLQTHCDSSTTQGDVRRFLDDEMK
jgi:hypothetical protein